MMSRMLGTIAAAAMPIGPAAADQDRRTPDAHIVRPPHSDVIDEAGAVMAPDHYAAPVSGWRYRAPAAGERLAAPFLAERYRVAHRRFGLARPARGAAWIRYGNDLLLVRLGSGEILRVALNGYR